MCVFSVIRTRKVLSHGAAQNSKRNADAKETVISCHCFLRTTRSRFEPRLSQITPSLITHCTTTELLVASPTSASLHPLSPITPSPTPLICGGWYPLLRFCWSSSFICTRRSLCIVIVLALRQRCAAHTSFCICFIYVSCMFHVPVLATIQLYCLVSGFECMNDS